MIQALTEQLARLTRDPKDPFLLTIKNIVGSRQAAGYANPLRKMVLALPIMVEGIRESLEKLTLDPSVRRLESFALVYLYSPTDYLPEKSFGLFGYVDDAYLVANVYERTLNEIEARGLKLKNKEQIDIDKVRDWIEVAKRLLPNEMGGIDRLLQDVRSRGGTEFGGVFSSTGNFGPVNPALKKMRR